MKESMTIQNKRLYGSYFLHVFSCSFWWDLARGYPLIQHATKTLSKRDMQCWTNIKQSRMIFKVSFSGIFCENMTSFSADFFLYGWDEREQENTEEKQESRALCLTMPLSGWPQNHSMALPCTTNILLLFLFSLCQTVTSLYLKHLFVPLGIAEICFS